MATRTDVLRCGKPTSTGRCRRRIATPGAPCGIDHAVQTSRTVATIAPASIGDPFEPPASPSVNWSASAAHWRTEAATARAKADEGKNLPARWNPAVVAELYDARAAICERAGFADGFAALYKPVDGENVRANARIIRTRFGARWAVFDDRDVEQIGKVKRWVPVEDEAAAAEAGFVEGREAARAWARLAVVTDEDDRQDAFVQTYRLDGDRPFTRRNLDDDSLN